MKTIEWIDKFTGKIRGEPNKAAMLVAGQPFVAPYALPFEMLSSE